MKKLLINISIYALLILTILVLLKYNRILKNNVNRLNNNIEAILIDSSKQQLITKKELKNYYSKQLDSILLKLDIKNKNIKEVIVTKYNYKDTTVVNYKTEKVIIQGEENFTLTKGCFTVKGSLDSTGLNLKEIENKDKLTYILYKSHKNKFLFIKWNPEYKAKIYSQCKNDTIPIELNLKVE